MFYLRYFFNNPSHIIPHLLALFTGDRYLPDIEWSKNSWTHNIFRVYELIFWRKYGIRAESSVTQYFDEYGRDTVKVELFTFEATCAHLETLIRNLFKIRWLHLQVTQLQFGLPVNTPELRIPFISFAVALDVATTEGAAASSSPATYTHTCTGSNLSLVVGSVSFDLGGAPTMTSTTYNGTSCTLVGSTKAVGTTSLMGLWYLLAPATGANTVSITFGGSSTIKCRGCSTSYTGTNQSAVDNTAEGSGSGNNPSVSITTNADNSWVNGMLGYLAVGTATASLTARAGYVTQTSTKGAMEDTNAAVHPAGSQAVGWTLTNSNLWGISIVSFAPVSAGSVIKTFNGLANASTKTINGVANASVKSWNGVSNV